MGDDVGCWMRVVDDLGGMVDGIVGSCGVNGETKCLNRVLIKSSGLRVDVPGKDCDVGPVGIAGCVCGVTRITLQCAN